MASFTKLKSRVLPLVLDDIDTDQIIPARFLKGTVKTGLGDVLFYDWRRLESGEKNPEFVLEMPSSAGAGILLAGANFGCGSSREHAPWALCDWGFRAVLALSFADIFRQNALKNGLLPIVLPREAHAELCSALEAGEDLVEVDLPSQELRLPSGRAVWFPVDEFAKHCLLHGIDELGYIQSFSEKVLAYEAKLA